MSDEVTENTEQITGKSVSSANLIPWKPGQSGNPGGRPKRKPITEAYERLIGNPEAAQEVAEALFDMIKSRGKNAVAAAKEVTDRLEGGVASSLAVTGADGGPVRFELGLIGKE